VLLEHELGIGLQLVFVHARSGVAHRFQDGERHAFVGRAVDVDIKCRHQVPDVASMPREVCDVADAKGICAIDQGLALRPLTDDDCPRGRTATAQYRQGLEERSQVLDGIEPADASNHESIVRKLQGRAGRSPLRGLRAAAQLDAVVDDLDRSLRKSFGDHVLFQRAGHGANLRRPSRQHWIDESTLPRNAGAMQPPVLGEHHSNRRMHHRSE
jgi:hypothetical protein